MDSAPSRLTHALALCGLGIAVYPLGLLTGHAPDLASHVCLFFLAFLPYLAAVALVLHLEAGSDPARADPSSPLSRGEAVEKGGWERVRVRVKTSLAYPDWSLILLVLAIALALRLLSLATHPSLSDDLYRYIWDGKVAYHGINPYHYPPTAPELEHLRGPLWTPVNAKDLTTPYPPFSQLIFVATYAVAGESVKAQQVVAALGDLLVVALLLVLLRRLALHPARVLVYAWNPLALMHLEHSAHNDAWMIAPLLAAVLAALAGRRAASALTLALAVLAKLFGGVAVGAVGARWRLRHAALAAAVVALAFAPFALGANPLRGVLLEAGDARFNDSLYLALERVLALAGPGARALASVVAGLLLLGAMALVYARVRAGASVVAGALALVGATIALSPVVEPWYALWPLPLVAARLRAGRPWAWTPAAGWLLFSGLIVLTELTYVDFSARTWIAVRALEYGALYAILAFDAAGWVLRSRSIRTYSGTGRSPTG